MHYHHYEHFYLWQGISLSVTDGLQMAQAKPGLQSAAGVNHIPLAGCGLRRISCFATWLQCRGLHYLCQCQLPSLQWLMTGWRYGGWRQPRVASAVGMSSSWKQVQKKQQQKTAVEKECFFTFCTVKLNMLKRLHNGINYCCWATSS